MKNIFLKLVASATLLIVSTSAFATALSEIEGEIAFFGFATTEYNDANTALKSVSFDTVNAVSATGDFTSVTVPTAATFNALAIDNTGNVTVVGGAEFWSVGDFTFTLTSIVHNTTDKNGLLNDFIATGILKAAGFADTSGMMKFSANQFNNQFVFAASAVPAPATIALFGLALVGFGVARRKKQV